MVQRWLGMTAVIALPFVAVLPVMSQDAAGSKSWRAANLDATARIHLRQRPHNRAKVLAYIPAESRGLRGGSCANNWCQIEFRGLKGWVFQRFIVPDDGNAGDAVSEPAKLEQAVASGLKKTLEIINQDGRPIPVYAFPNDSLPVAGRLPPDTVSVEGLGACVGSFCYVRSGALVGWLRDTMFRSDGGEEPLETTAALGEKAMGEEGKTLNKTVPTASQAAAVTAALPSAVTDPDIKTYTLAGLAEQSSLPMRRKPDAASAIVAWIPNDAKNVEGLRKCIEKWCLVRHGNASGWVARRHLADTSVESSQTFQVIGLPLWQSLDVVDYPSPTAAVVGQIPSYATGIVPIGGCDREWCHVRYLGIVGWVKGASLEPQRR